jgi:hypothetical protein
LHEKTNRRNRLKTFEKYLELIHGYASHINDFQTKCWKEREGEMIFIKGERRRAAIEGRSLHIMCIC